ncbi:hypothetical protein I6E87_001906 [Enterococcus faecalis]|uniref:hypothetical protein n=1 Tax=Enterococcus faecalis TaxID=1351 RepID=UPI0019DF5373|nr:hypothetical protein [Enterococcus faecalis]EGO2800501.1 hypothetical protein [Enterococcus faecalis]EGO8511833.1 hypothetical protein [Enterococcus faecalis]EGQ7428330.1 hypothetical protein [Enterococcus faecalis]EJB2752618.1 hypothetical protein [Enterococcus faecalis]EKZ0433728.1 hypothetical protein [Enterococcus faecalis]
MKNDAKKMFNELKKEMIEIKNKCKATLTSSAFYRVQLMNLIYFIRYRAMIVCLLYALNFILLCYELDKSLGLSKQQLFTSVADTLSKVLLLLILVQFVAWGMDIMSKSRYRYRREPLCRFVKYFIVYSCVLRVYSAWQGQIPNIQTLDDIPRTLLSNLVTFLLSSLAIHLFWKNARNHLAVITDYREKREASSIPKRIQDQVILFDYAGQIFVPVDFKIVEHENEIQPAYIEGQSSHIHIGKYLRETFVTVKLKWSIIEPKSLSVQECVLENDSSFTLEEASE